ncbi:MAG TPA: sulfatase-like hydrolase/transferase [Dysgonamonadaceae bacterium]|nr:sulfatase-like hydrolase/transferase [Dysgonamonadaceae bacterium]
MRNKKKSPFWGNIYVVLVLRILLVFAFYTITRFLFYLLNKSLFSDIDNAYLLELMYHGLRFDASAIAYTNSLVVLLHILPFRFRYNKGSQKAISIIFYVVNAIAITLNMVDVVYYRFTMRRTTTGIFQEFENENTAGFIRFIWEYWYVTLMVMALVTVMVWVYRKIKVQSPYVKLRNYLYYPIGLILMAVIGYYTVGAMRGGYAAGTRPITLNNAAEYIRKPEHRSIVLNTPFALIRTIDKKQLSRKEYFDNDDELNAIFNVEHQFSPDSTSLFNKFEGRNVILIIWESFHREWVGALNRDIEGYSGYTPFIDSLSTDGYLFARGYANGRKSIDALPSIISGIPSSETPFVLSHYSNNKLNSLASLLKRKGYYSAFFHGAPNGSMGFSAFTQQTGFHNYFGMTEYGNKKDFDGHWGIWDKPFLQYMAKEINTFREPFLASVFTLSSHHPYNVPSEYEGVFPKGDIPIHQSVGYSDNAMRKFFETASQQDWYNNTLFVITADHAVDGWLPQYKTAEGAFTIPFLFYAPGSDLIGYNDSTVVQQTDIMPTLLSLLGVEDKFIAFGNNMFDPNSPHFAYNYYNGAYQLIEGEWMLQYMNDCTIGFYNVVEDRLMNNNVIDKHPALQTKMEQRIKALIQQYNNRLIDNKLAP